MESAWKMPFTGREFLAVLEPCTIHPRPRRRREHAMKCPRCKTPTDLVQVKLNENVVVDACRVCKGIYFDQEELGDFLQLTKDLPNYRAMLKDAVASFPCPSCSQTMKELNYVRGADVAVDTCEACGGMWLDGGEIGQIQTLAQEQELPSLRLLRSMWDMRCSLRGEARGCPKCDGKVEKFDVDERVTLDLCNKCHGFWFDAGEITDYFELTEDIPNLAQALASARPTGTKCTMCASGTELVEMPYSPRELESGKLMIDYCQGCKGIWIDAKEWVMLECLIAASSEGVQERMGRAVKKLEAAGYKVLG
jgi:Zn-finger nucleic acid-binding protein